MARQFLSLMLVLQSHIALALNHTFIDVAPPAPRSVAAPGDKAQAAASRRRPNSQSPFPDLQGPPPGLDGTPGSESGEDEGASRPKNSWNPSDATEAFPAVPPPGD